MAPNAAQQESPCIVRIIALWVANIPNSVLHLSLANHIQMYVAEL